MTKIDLLIRVERSWWRGHDNAHGIAQTAQLKIQEAGSVGWLQQLFEVN
jgi:hypothetical protein